MGHVGMVAKTLRKSWGFQLPTSLKLVSERGISGCHQQYGTHVSLPIFLGLISPIVSGLKTYMFPWVFGPKAVPVDWELNVFSR